MASRSGLNDAESQDVVQEVFIIVFRKIPDFRYDPARGSFQSWLALIARRRIEKQLKKRLPLLQTGESTRTSTINRVPADDGFESTRGTSNGKRTCGRPRSPGSKGD